MEPSVTGLQAFIINLDAAKDRWSFIETVFAKTQVTPMRVPAVDGNALTLPIKEFSQKSFHWFHGRAINIREVGCYLSHVQAMRAFLVSEAEYGIIGEDDISPQPGFDDVIEWALTFSQNWNILRLSGLSQGTPLIVGPRWNEYKLCVSLSRVKGAGCYLIDRVAAKELVNHLLPMWLPFDHALDREWFYGLRAAYILPFPCSQIQKHFSSSIQTGNTGKQHSKLRWATTYPYQAYNELMRFLFRTLCYLRWKVILGWMGLILGKRKMES